MVNGTGLLGASLAHATTEHAAEATTAAAEELREQVLGVHATSTTGATLQALFTILVVDATLLIIRQDLVSVRQLLKLLSGIRVVGVLVYMGRVGVSKNPERYGEFTIGQDTYQGDTEERPSCRQS